MRHRGYAPSLVCLLAFAFASKAVQPPPGGNPNPYLVRQAGANPYETLPDKRLAAPPLASIYSAEALNGLLAEIGKLPAGNARVELKEDARRRINVSRGNGRDIGLLKHAKRLGWPMVLRQAEYKTARDQVDALLPRAAEQARKGKVDAAILTDLSKSEETMQQQLMEQVGDISPIQYIEAKRFLVRLGRLLKTLAEPDVDVYFKLTDQLAARGKTVDELVKFMTEKKLLFAPAVEGDEDAYVVLHKALLAYRTGLRRNAPGKDKDR